MLFPYAKCKVIVYDTESMQLFDMIPKSIEEDSSTSGNFCTLTGYITNKKVILDPTTMLLIAKHNKTQELDELNSQIKSAKKFLEDFKLKVEHTKEKYCEMLKLIYDDLEMLGDDDED